MIYIDKYAYISNLKNTKPELKLLFGVAALLACISSKSILSFVLVLGFMIFMTVFKAKIPFNYYIKLMTLPFGFLFFSVIGIIVNVQFDDFSTDSIWSMSIGNLYAYVSPKGLDLAIHLILKSIASISCLYFIILTTPMRDIISILGFFKCSNTIITLLTIIYQFIFLLMETSIMKIKSQQCRHGYDSSKNFVKNFGMLWSSVFVQYYINIQWIYKSMQARGHNVYVKFVPKKVYITIKELFMICVFLAAVIGSNFLYSR